MDKTSLNRVSLMHPLLRTELVNILTEIEQKEVNIRLTQTLRTTQEQNDLYAIGRTKPGKPVTNARGGTSYHNYGLATDFCLLHKDGSISWNMHEDLDKDGIADWMEVVSVFEKYGWKWGGKFLKIVDTPHFEKSFNKTVKELQKLYNDKKFIEGTTYVKL